MDNIGEKIEELTRRINELARQQTSISSQLVQLIKELELLKHQANSSGTSIVKDEKEKPREKVVEHAQVIEAPVPGPVQPQDKYPKTPIHKPSPSPIVTPNRPAAPKKQTGFEEFIGKNVASKVGILVLIIGIFIGAKYSIEHNLVSPEVRIISGYISGLLLIGIAIRLKKKYEVYSSVLMGGGLSVLYFITYTAYAFYGKIPIVAAFIIMLVLTVVIVYTAVLYNRVLIAHLAQVGAYAIPFLLSNNSGQYEILFTYIAIINAGILVLSFMKYWKSLFYVAYGVTWFIFGSWYLIGYDPDKHFSIALLFLTIFFISFYITFLAYKLIKKEQYDAGDVIVLMSNAFIFYGFGYATINTYTKTENLTGAFTVINAGIHLVVSQVIRKMKLADRALYYLVLGLMMVYLTIAVPVQFDGNWVTLLWIGEAVLVFVVGRTRKVRFYESLGIGLIFLGLASLAIDWFWHIDNFHFGHDNYSISRSTYPVPFANMIFVTGLLVVLAQAGIIWLHSRKKYVPAYSTDSIVFVFYQYIVPAFLLMTLYTVFFLEIMGYFLTVERMEYARTRNYENAGVIQNFSSLALYLYSLVFCLLLMLVNRVWIKKVQLAATGLIGTTILLLLLLAKYIPLLNSGAFGLYNRMEDSLKFGSLHLLMRYSVFLVMAILLWQGRHAMIHYVKERMLNNAWTLMIHVGAIYILSAEYLMWTGTLDPDRQYKLGLTVVWGIYALALIIYGIWKKLKFLRLAGIVFLGMSLLKLVFYDLAGAGTITKTVSFISLGVLLLLVSYLYNRYKEVLFGEDRPEVKS